MMIQFLFPFPPIIPPSLSPFPCFFVVVVFPVAGVVIWRKSRRMMAKGVTGRQAFASW